MKLHSKQTIASGAVYPMASGDPECDECGTRCVVVELGDPFDHGSFTARVCAACLRAALALLDEQEPR